MPDSQPTILAPATVDDYRWLAKRRLPRQIFDYIDGGAYDEHTLAENVNAFARTPLRQRILRDVSAIDTSVMLLGKTWPMPVALAPVGFAGMFARRAEVQAARAAHAIGVPFTLSTVGICPIEEVREASAAPFWFQLYMLRDRGYAKALLERAAAAGCPVLVFTLDLAVVGSRYRDRRNGIGAALSAGAKLSVAFDYARRWGWLKDVAFGGRPLVFGNLTGAVPPGSGLPQMRAWIDAQFDASVTWKDLEWVRKNWSGPIVLKGILDQEDAKAAVASIGPEGIVVSNHGGRQLDGVEAPIDVVPRVRSAVDGKTIVLMDGGVRSGLDVVKAIARGAHGCMIGRAWAYAVAARGQAGVTHVLKNMQDEMRVAMALTGVTRVDQITDDVLVRKPG